MEDATISQKQPFGAWLKKQRKDRKLSQATVAFRAGVSPAYISLIERTADGGKEKPPQVSREVAEGLAAALDLPERDVLLAAGFHVENPLANPDTEIEVVRLSDGRAVTIIGLDAPTEDRELIKAVIRRILQSPQANKKTLQTI